MNNTETKFEKESMDMSECEGPRFRREDITVSLPYGLVKKIKTLTEGEKATDLSIDDLVGNAIAWLFDTNYIYREAFGLVPEFPDVFNGQIEVSSNFSKECIGGIDALVVLGTAEDRSSFIRKAVTYYLRMVFSSASREFL